MTKLIEKMNAALGWELRAINMYALCSKRNWNSPFTGLSPMFTTEMTESIEHADIVRKGIVQLGGIPVTERDPHPINHTTKYTEMLNYSLETEVRASEVYAELLPLIDQTDDLYDSIEQIYYLN